MRSPCVGLVDDGDYLDYFHQSGPAGAVVTHLHTRLAPKLAGPSSAGPRGVPYAVGPRANEADGGGGSMEMWRVGAWWLAAVLALGACTGSGTDDGPEREVGQGSERTSEAESRPDERAPEENRGAAEVITADEDGIAGAALSARADDLVERLTAAFGPPIEDSGFVEAPCLPGEGVMERTVRWAGLAVVLEDGGSGPALSGWRLDEASGEAPAGFEVVPPVRLGTPWAQLEALGARWDDFYGTWAIGGLTGRVTGDLPTPNATVDAVGGGYTGLLGC